MPLKSLARIPTDTKPDTLSTLIRRPGETDRAAARIGVAGADRERRSCKLHLLVGSGECDLGRLRNLRRELDLVLRRASHRSLCVLPIRSKRGRCRFAFRGECALRRSHQGGTLHRLQAEAIRPALAITIESGPC